MGRTLRWLGSLLLLTTVGLWVADAVEWIPTSLDDRWSGLTLKLAIGAMGGWLLLRLLAPIGAKLRNGRCTVCGCATDRGHTYCLDHLRETVNQTRDKSRERPIPRPRTSN
jgi:hypothetical protein